MGLNTKAYLVVGVTMAKLFTKIEDKSSVYDEHDKFGNKTGKQFKEEKLMGTLPNGNVACIAENKNEYGNGWDYDFYVSLGFDDSTYVGDNENITIGIHLGNHDSDDLNQMIIGLEVCETGWMDENKNDVQKVDEIETNEGIFIARKELAELFGYVGDINLYLINYISY